jgi:hypothetical protein
MPARALPRRSRSRQTLLQDGSKSCPLCPRAQNASYNHSYRNCRRIGSPEAQDKASCRLKLAHLRAGG